MCASFPHHHLHFSNNNNPFIVSNALSQTDRRCFPKKTISLFSLIVMDSSSPHQSWLGFSLSNDYHMPPTSSSDPNSHLSLFQSFNSNNNSGIIDRQDTDGSDPKLEDFLGGGARGNSPFGGCSSAMVPFSSESPATNTISDVYDSELKSLAASFLCGYSGDQNNSEKQLTVVPPEPAAKKAVDNFGQRTSIYRGVTRHRWTGRYEAHLWDNSCRREGQSRKGRQVYLGGYDKEDKAARAYDLAALKYWGPTTTTNFPITNYENELIEMKNMTRQEFVASLRRKSSGFSRGASIYRGVTRHHQHGRWQARIGRVAGNKDLYLGTFSTQEEAAEAYDIAAIKFRGLNAVTNFDMSRYDVKSIVSSNLPIGGANNKTAKTNSSDSASESKSADMSRSEDRDLSSASSLPFSSSNTLSFALPLKQDATDYWSALGYNNPYAGTPSSFNINYPNAPPVSDNLNVGYYQQQVIESGNRLVPYATPVTLNGSNNFEDGNFGNGSVAPPVYSFPSAKPNLSFMQTPIFGME